MSLHSARVNKELAEENRRNWEQLIIQVEARRDREAEQHADVTPNMPVAAIPRLRVEQEPLTDERRRHFRANLEEVVKQAEQLPPANELKVLDVLHAPELPRECCTACQGYCCQTGNNHAYLDPQSVRRVWDAHPHFSARELVDSIYGDLPDRVFAESCLFHTKDGCSLAPPKRSNICHQFFCRGLKQAIEATRKNEAAHVFLTLTHRLELYESKVVPTAS